MKAATSLWARCSEYIAQCSERMAPGSELVAKYWRLATREQSSRSGKASVYVHTPYLGLIQRAIVALNLRYIKS